MGRIRIWITQQAKISWDTFVGAITTHQSWYLQDRASMEHNTLQIITSQDRQWIRMFVVGIYLLWQWEGQMISGGWNSWRIRTAGTGCIPYSHCNGRWKVQLAVSSRCRTLYLQRFFWSLSAHLFILPFWYISKGVSSDIREPCFKFRIYHPFPNSLPSVDNANGRLAAWIILALRCFNGSNS